MQYTALVTKEGKQTLAAFPGCPGCQTFADPGEDIVVRAEEALAGWLEANLVSGQSPPEPTTVRARGRAKAIPIAVPAKLAVTLAVRWARKHAGMTQAELARRAGLSQPVVARLEDPDHNPTLDTLERVAVALGTRLEVGLLPAHKAARPPAPGASELRDTVSCFGALPSATELKKLRRLADRVATGKETIHLLLPRSS